jgi:hypothetical protein
MSDHFTGLADHASVMIEGDKIKGGSMHYTFGFTDTNGVIKCPDINVTVTAPTEEIKGMLPVVTCGQYFLRLWGAPDHPYTDYAGYCEFRILFEILLTGLASCKTCLKCVDLAGGCQRLCQRPASAGGMLLV